MNQSEGRIGILNTLLMVEKKIKCAFSRQILYGSAQILNATI